MSFLRSRGIALTLLGVLFWIPACAGMTRGGAGMTRGGAGMTRGGAGMTRGDL